VIAVENRLRSLMGLAANDGRLISSSTPWDADEYHCDWKTIHAEALANRTELRIQRKQLEKHRRILIRAKAESAKITSDSPTLPERLKMAEVSHCHVVAVRAIYDIGRASIDLLLQAIQRRAVAESSHHRSLADYARARARGEYRKATLLEAYGVSVVE
jgi:hypothetical protein